MEAAPTSFVSGRYRVIEPLGEGGMSTVYRVHDTRLDVHRAVKVLAPKLAGSATLRIRFVREARTMAKLQHAAVVGVQDIVEDGARLLIVMELLEGGTLAEWVARHGPMPVRMALETLLPIVTALEAAHEAGVVHRDLKLSNILLSRRGGAKLSDFGIAHVATVEGTARHTTPGQLLGTWEYMSPEQRSGSSEDADARTDVYGFGAVIFALATATLPRDLFASSEVEKLLGRLPAELVPLVVKATRYDRSARFQSMTELRAAMVALLDELPASDATEPPLVAWDIAASPSGPGRIVSPEFRTPGTLPGAGMTIVAPDFPLETAEAPLAAQAAAPSPPKRRGLLAASLGLTAILCVVCAMQWPQPTTAAVAAFAPPVTIAPQPAAAAPSQVPPAKAEVKTPVKVEAKAQPKPVAKPVPKIEVKSPARSVASAAIVPAPLSQPPAAAVPTAAAAPVGNPWGVAATAAAAPESAAPATTLANLGVDVEGDRITIAGALSGAATRALMFEMEGGGGGSRVVIRLPGARSNLRVSSLPIASTHARRVSVTPSGPDLLVTVEGVHQLATPPVFTQKNSSFTLVINGMETSP